MSNVVEFPARKRREPPPKRTLEELAGITPNPFSTAANMLFHSHIEALADAKEISKKLEEEFNGFPPDAA